VELRFRQSGQRAARDTRYEIRAQARHVVEGDDEMGVLVSSASDEGPVTNGLRGRGRMRSSSHEAGYGVPISKQRLSRRSELITGQWEP
jgi:hypothetical protein